MLVIDGEQNITEVSRKASQNLPVKVYLVSSGDRGLSKVHTNYVGNPGLNNQHSLVGNFKYK